MLAAGAGARAGGPKALRRDADGRVKKLGPESLEPGDYCLEFDVATPVLPRVIIEFTIQDSSHYHVPVLLSPYGYTTYRGS